MVEKRVVKTITLFLRNRLPPPPPNQMSCSLTWCGQVVTTTTTITTEEKYRVLAPESMQETFMSDSEDEGGEYPPTSPPWLFHVIIAKKYCSFFAVWIGASVTDEYIYTSVQFFQLKNLSSFFNGESKYQTKVDKRLNNFKLTWTEIGFCVPKMEKVSFQQVNIFLS
jgi:hypothetical protein